MSKGITEVQATLIAASMQLIIRRRSFYESLYIAHREGNQADKALAGCLGALLYAILPSSWPKDGMGRWVAKQM